MKNIKGLITVAILLLISLLFIIILTGCSNKQPTPLEKKNIETLKKVNDDDLVVCVDPDVNPISYRNIRKIFIVRYNNKERSELAGYMFDHFIIDLTQISYKYFQDCRIENWGNFNSNPALIGQIILDGIHRTQDTQTAKPTSE